MGDLGADGVLAMNQLFCWHTGEGAFVEIDEIGGAVRYRGLVFLFHERSRQ